MRQKRGIPWGSLLPALLGAGALLYWSEAAARGARLGLTACGAVILPAVFPFLVFSVYLVHSPAGAASASLLGRAAGRCYRLPPQAAAALIPGWVGGYPAGAGALAELLAAGKITLEDARFGVLVLIHSGPAFLAGVVGEHLFGSTLTGVFLFLTQLAAGLLSAKILALFLHRPSPQKTLLPPPQKSQGSATARLLHAVTAATAVTLKITAFVVLCSAASEVLTAMGVFPVLMRVIAFLTGGAVSGETARAFLTGLLEISAGSAAAASLPPLEAAKILPFLLSFGGLSVALQASAPFREGEFPWGRFLLGRVLHGALTALLAAPWLPGRVAAYAMGGARVLASGGGELLWGTFWMLTLCLMLFCRWELGPSGK